MDQEKIYKPRGVVLQCANLYRHLSIVPSRLPGALVRDEDGGMIINSKLPTDTFNKITHLIMEDDEDLPKRLREMADEFGDLPFVWWLGPDTMPTDMGRHIEAMGYVKSETMLGMSLELQDMADYQPRLEQEIGLQIKWVDTKEQINAYAELLAGLWNPADSHVLSAYDQVADKLLMPGMPIRFALAYVDDKPVCGVEYWLGPGRLVGAYGLVCLEEWRNKGIASALLQHGLDYFKNEKNYESATLQASALGQGLYARLGFRPYGEWVEYAKTPEPA